jgi:hypothetical protein
MDAPMLREWHDWFRRQSQQRAFRWGTILLFVGLLGVAAIFARTHPWSGWRVATNGMDGNGHPLIQPPTTVFEECRNLEVVWPGLALIVAFAALLTLALALGNRAWASWANGDEPGRVFFVAFGGFCFILGGVGFLIALAFLAIQGP